MENNNQNDEKDISIEEFEEDDVVYEDDNLVDNDDIEVIQHHVEFEFVKDGDEMNVDDEGEPNLIEYPKEFETFVADGEIYSISMNDKGIAVLGDGEDTTYFYDVNKKELLKKEKINKDSVVNLEFSNDYKYVASASLDGSVNIFDGQDFKLLKTFNGSFSEINVKFFIN
jgi:WD40 repeat protein